VKLNTLMAIMVILWVGMLLAIDFAAIVKFSTPSLSRPVAFDVGRVVFSAFNKVQLCLMLAVLASALFAGLASIDNSLIAMVFIVLMLQVFWLFPGLSHQVDVALSGMHTPRSYQHHLYGVFEVTKIISLFILGIRLLK